MKKQTLIMMLTLVMACMLCACGGNDGKTIDKYEKANKKAISAAVEVMGDNTLALRDDMEWGMSYDETKKGTTGPYVYDTTVGFATAFYVNLPAGDGWKDENGNLVPDNFIPTDTLSYYAMDESIGLYEYGYMAYNPNLYQYDFLKEYYTNKFGEPTKENWEWNNSSYEPTGKEDYHEMFAEGLVKALTVWDIEELNTVLVIDWLNDPKDEQNNFGQISFYQRTEGFSVEEIDSAETTETE